MSYKIHISSVATVAGINNTKNQGTRTSKDSRPERRLIRRWVEVYKPERMKLPLEAENERKEEAAKTKTKDMGKKSKEEDEGYIFPRTRRTKDILPRTRTRTTSELRRRRRHPVGANSKAMMIYVRGPSLGL